MQEKHVLIYGTELNEHGHDVINENDFRYEGTLISVDMTKDKGLVVQANTGHLKKVNLNEIQVIR